MSTRQQKRKLDPLLQADVDFLALLFANGISGLVQIGLSDGIKMKGAMERVMKNKAAMELCATTWAKFFQVNPQAAEIIEMAAAINPKVSEFLERVRLKPKDVAPEDVSVRDGEKG
jgi:hypothetical protein